MADVPSPFSLRDWTRLDGIHPELREKLRIVFGQMLQAGHRMFVVQGVRTAQQQQELYASGRTKPGTIVTFCDGIVHKSNHQPHADGYGHAVDCAFDIGRPFDDAQPWGVYGAFLEAQGLTWGGRWEHPHDSPHAELPDPPKPATGTNLAAEGPTQNAQQKS